MNAAISPLLLILRGKALREFAWQKTKALMTPDTGLTGIVSLAVHQNRLNQKVRAEREEPVTLYTET